MVHQRPHLQFLRDPELGTPSAWDSRVAIAPWCVVGSPPRGCEICIANARSGHFGDAFFFSVQTMASIGYGAMYPLSLCANLLVTLEDLSGVAGTAGATGLVFARISRPTARVMFSRVAVIHIQDGCPTLMFRAANQRSNQIVEAQIRVTLARNQDLQASQAELIITLTGIDDAFSQTIHARHSYLADEILWGHRYSPPGQRWASLWGLLPLAYHSAGLSLPTSIPTGSPRKVIDKNLFPNLSFMVTLNDRLPIV